MGEDYSAENTGTLTSEGETGLRDYMASLRYAGMIQRSMLPLPALMSALHQKGSPGEAPDAIDMSLCIFNQGSYELQFSGANRPLFIVSAGELREVKADKMPIGPAPLMEEPFSNSIVRFDENDMFYLFSDGFPDQFGGPDNKKFKYNQFRNMLSEAGKYEAAGQKQFIGQVFEEWKGPTQQVDDVTIFGFKPRIL